MAGIFGLSALIGRVSDGLDRRIEKLRKGRSLVIESDHTLVLGWSSKLHDLLNEIVLANANQRDAAIVVLAPVDKVVMDDFLHVHVPNRRTTRIVCRNGDPANTEDLRM